jgi:hypothetical protein
MKVELIYISDNMNDNLETQLNKIIFDAKTFFENVLEQPTELLEVIQENSIVNYDLNCKNYELGSYGIRMHKNLFHWVQPK